MLGPPRVVRDCGYQPPSGACYARLIYAFVKTLTHLAREYRDTLADLSARINRRQVDC